MTHPTRAIENAPAGCGVLGRGLRLALVAGAAMVLGAACVAPGRQMPLSPVFVNDSPRAADAIVRAGELASIGNVEEAASVLQSLLDNEGNRMLASAADPDLFTPVRVRVMEMLSASPALLERYRAVENEAARRMLDSGDAAGAERTRLLTPAGYEAALRLAQERMEAARFDSALVMLESLSSHPDRKGEAAQWAEDLVRRMASTTAGTATGDRAAALLGAWTGAAKVEPGESPEIAPSRGVFDALAPAMVDGMLSRPLWSDSLGERLPVMASGAAQRSGGELPENARWLHVVPSVVGDSVYVSDSQTITSWNRFTLSQRWRVKFEGVQGRNYNIGPQSGFEELAQVAADGRTVAAVVGLAIQGNLSIRRTLVALDAATGRTRWTRTLSELGLAESSQSALIGPAMLDQDVVVAGIRRTDQNRRLDGYAAVGIDAATGQTLWSESIASAGSPAYGVSAGVVDAPLVRDGLVYVVSSVGFSACFESVSGRVRWIRRLPAGTRTQSQPDEPWASNTPVVLDGVMFIVHPARNEVLALDARTGMVRQRMASSRMDNPSYLVGAGGKLLGVSSTSIVATDAAGFGPAAPVSRLARFSSDELRGRVVVAGGQVVAPVRAGVEFYDPSLAEVDPVKTLALSKPGNVLPIESQLLVVDDREVHTYLLWEAAEAMLREQMDESPGDPGPAITYAELAHRASRPDVIVGAVDRAMAAIEADPLRTSNAQHQSRLFRALFEMVEPTAGAVGSVPPPALRGALIERLGRCASTKQEQVSHLLAAGAFYDASALPERAVEAYQRVLDSRDLAETNFSQGETTVSAAFEATRRLRRAISTHGPGVYAAYQADAARLLGEAAASSDPEVFERLARRYPVASAAVDAWILAASRHTAQGRPKLAGQALEEGLAAARLALAGDDPRQGELAGRLVRHLIDTGLLHPARAALRAFVRDTPGGALSYEGERIDASALLADVDARLARLNRRPVLGERVGQHQQMLEWGVLEPVSLDAPQNVTDRVLMVSEKDEIAMFAARGPGLPQKLWSGSAGEVFLAMDDRGVLMAFPRGHNDAADFEFIRRDIDSGVVAWRSGPFRTLLEPGPLDRLLASVDNPIAPRIETPMTPALPVTMLSTAFDDRTLVAMDKIGRAVAFDLETGRVLWRSDGVIPRVHAVALEAGTLLVTGADGPVDFSNPVMDTHAGDAMPAVAVVLDARSGQPVTSWTGQGRVRWAKLSPEGLPVIGLDEGVVALDPYRGTVRWRASGKELRSTLHGWTLPGRVIVRDESDRLWRINAADGAVGAEPLDVRGRMDDGFGTVLVSDLDGRTCVRTRLGLVLLDEADQVVGADAHADETPMDFVALGAGHAVTLNRASSLDDVSQSRYELNIYELGSLKATEAVDLMLPSNADVGQCAIIDGKVLITTGAVVTVIDLE